MYRRNSIQDIEKEDDDDNDEKETLDYDWEINLIVAGAYIIDGDMFDVDSSDRIRLADIEAPESGETE